MQRCKQLNALTFITLALASVLWSTGCTPIRRAGLTDSSPLKLFDETAPLQISEGTLQTPRQSAQVGDDELAPSMSLPAPPDSGMTSGPATRSDAATAAGFVLPEDGYTTTVRGQQPGYYGSQPFAGTTAQPSAVGGALTRGPLPVSGGNVQPALGQVPVAGAPYGVTSIPSNYTAGGARPIQYTAPPINSAYAVPGTPDPRVAQLQATQVQPVPNTYGAPGTYSTPPASGVPPLGQSPSYGGQQYGTRAASPPVARPAVTQYGNAYGQSAGQSAVPPQPPTEDPASAYPRTMQPVAPARSAPVTAYQGAPSQQPVDVIGPPIEPAFPGVFDPLSNPESPPAPLLQPRVRTVPVDVFVAPARTGRFTIGGAVNSDAGLTGQIVLDERNFDILRFPRSFQDLFSGYAFRGGGQTFRLEAVPGSDFQRYMASFGQPYLFNYLPVSLSVQGFLFDRRYRDWDESRLGGRVQLGYRLTNQLSVSTALRAENVDFNNLRLPGTSGGYLESFLGTHNIYSGSVRLTHDTRDIPFAPTEGHLFELTYEQTFGDFSYDRWQADYRKYYLLRQRADRSGRHTVAFTNRVGISGSDTPVFENFFAGGYSTIRGFDFRGASPKIGDNQVGGRFSFLGSVEYQFPLTADDATKGVVFVDYGTVEQDIEIDKDNFRVAPGFGFRVSMPALGPAPLAFDFAFPVAHADTDERQVFSFFMGFSR